MLARKRDLGYIESNKIIESFSITNDVTERGVKLRSHYLSLARNEENFQNFLQVSVCIREVILDLRKKNGKFNELKVNY